MAQLLVIHRLLCLYDMPDLDLVTVPHEISKAVQQDVGPPGTGGRGRCLAE